MNKEIFNPDNEYWSYHSTIHSYQYGYHIVPYTVTKQLVAVSAVKPLAQIISDTRSQSSQLS